MVSKLCYILLLKFLLQYGEAADENDLPVIELPNNLQLFEVNKYLSTIRVNIDDGTDCMRPCRVGYNRICYKRFYVEHFSAMGPACGNCSRGVLQDCFRKQCVPTDGYEKGIITINRQMPGPLIEVCQDDLLVIDVFNQMHSETFTIHWHGILQQKTPYMDGVPHVTQCPINPKTRFRYTFFAEEYGTYFYHSHSGSQRYLGAYGGLVIRRPLSMEPVAKLYEEDMTEHTVLISDWSHESSETFVVGLPTRAPGLLPQSILINGKGKFFDEVRRELTVTPYETFYVTPGKRYRFRLIDAGSTACPVQIQFENHTMTIIAADGSNTKPLKVDTLYMHTGERFDVVLEATEKSGLFWVHIQSVGICQNNRVFQTAVLSYEPGSGERGLSPSVRPEPSGFPYKIIMNHPEMDCRDTPNNYCVKDLISLDSPSNWRKPPSQKEYLSVGIRPMNTTAFFESNRYTPFLNIDLNDISLPTVNGISHEPTTYPILSQGNQNDINQFCDKNNIPDFCNDMQICVCTHAISIKYKSMVQFVMFDESPDSFPLVHPLHYHGYKFSVVAQGRLPGNTSITVERLKQMEAEGLFKTDNESPVLKDTICVQNQGYAVIKFEANNPGAWMMHCHVEDHMVYGMTLVMGVRGPVPPVPRNFPKCGDF